MSKISRIISGFAVLFIVGITLVSCGGYNFYQVWKDAGADIQKDHVFEVISLESAKKKIEEDQTFVLVIATPNASSAKSIEVLEKQAEYFNFDKKLYFIDITKELESLTSRKEVKEALNIFETAKAASNVLVVCYNKGDVILDTSLNVTDTSLENFVSNGSIDYYAVASYLFNDYHFE